MPELNSRCSLVDLLAARTGTFEEAFGKVGLRDLGAGKGGAFRSRIFGGSR